jgi:hypothetical protein
MIATAAPGATGASSVRGIREVPIEHDALGCQRIEGRSIDPGVAVAAEGASLQATGREDKDFHGS